MLLNVPLPPSPKSRVTLEQGGSKEETFPWQKPPRTLPRRGACYLGFTGHVPGAMRTVLGIPRMDGFPVWNIPEL